MRAIALSSLLLVAACGGKVEPSHNLTSDGCDTWSSCVPLQSVGLSCVAPDIAAYGVADRDGCRAYYCCPPGTFR